MSGLGGLGAHGNGAYCLEPTRTGPAEGAARGRAKAFDAVASRAATAANRPSSAQIAASHAQERRWCIGSRTPRPTIEPQAGGLLGAEDSGAGTPAVREAMGLRGPQKPKAHYLTRAFPSMFLSSTRISCWPRRGILLQCLSRLFPDHLPGQPGRDIHNSAG